MENTQVLNEDNTIVNQEHLIGELDKIITKRSIAKRVSDVQPLKGPVGVISGVQFDGNKLTIAKADVEAVTEKILSEFTIEALQDLEGIYKEDFYKMLAHYLSDSMIYKIDEKFLTMVKDRASTKGTLTFSGAEFNNSLWAVGQSIAITVNKGLCDLPISDNRSAAGWAVVSSNIASILGVTVNFDNDELVNDDSPSYMGRIAGVDYYIDYTYSPEEAIAEIPAVAQVTDVSAGTLVDTNTYSITVNGNLYDLQYVVATHTDVNGYMTALAALVNASADVSASSTNNIITVTSLVAGSSYTITVDASGLLTVIETQANVEFVAGSPANHDYVVFGIKGNGFSKGSTIFSPYTQQWIDTIDPETGEQIFFLLDRTAMAINPLDEKYYNGGVGVSGFLGKFNVDTSNLAVIN